MARVLEHHSKQLLRDRGIVVPHGEEAASPEAAEEGAARLGEVFVKALVPANRRARAGGVRIAKDPVEAGRAAAALLGSLVAGHEVRSVLVEEALTLERELFLSLVVDKDRKHPVALAGAHGGVDIEETVDRSPGALHTLPLDPRSRPLPHSFRELWAAAGLGGPELLAASTLSHKAAAVFYDTDAQLLELNPLGLVRAEDGTLGAVAVGVVLEVDDAALPRQPEVAAIALVGADSARPRTPREEEALAVAAFEPYRGTARFLELEGVIGLLCGGGGGSLAFYEAVRSAGGRPACLTELGGNPSAEKVRRLAHVVLSCPGVQGLLVGHNITNNTQIDLVAEGVVAALRERGLDPHEFPVVAREVGTHDQIGREILERAGVEYLGEGSSIGEAAVRIVERVGAA